MANGKYCIYCMSKMDGNENACPNCGKVNENYQALNHHLIPFTILNGKYLIGRVLGEGGFGITYIARDLNLDIQVAIKEYFPYGCVNRNHSYSESITVSGTVTAEEFENGKNKLMNEARILARFSSLNGIVGVRDFFLFNNTAYIVMDYLEGITLKEYFKSHEPVSFSWMTELLMPIMEDLVRVHEVGLIHRDISPDNIMLLKDGTARLLDFGAARQMDNGDIKSRSIVLKPGYTPEEQYRTKGEMGPWTDIYAISATIYRAVTGNPPEEALQRLVEDTMKTPSELGVRIDKEQESVLMKGLAVSPGDRYQNFQEFITALKNSRSMTEQNKTKPGFTNKLYKALISAFAVILVAAAGAIAVTKNQDDRLQMAADNGKMTENSLDEENRNETEEIERWVMETETEEPVVFTMESDPQGFYALAVPMDDSPIHWYDYDGFLDDILDAFRDCDYDNDGLQDYVYRYYNADEWFCSYEIRFGNGLTLMLDGESDPYMDCSVSAADMDGDGQNEILFVGKHTSSTMPVADIRVYHNENGQWKGLRLPYQENADKDSLQSWVGFDIIFEYREEDMLTVSSEENGYQEIVKRYTEVEPEEFFPDGMNMDAMAAWDAQIVESNGKYYLALIQNVAPPATPYWYFQPVGSVLELRDQEFHLVRMGEDVAKRYWRNEWNYYVGTSEGPVLRGEEGLEETLIPRTNVPVNFSQMIENENGKKENGIFGADLYTDYIDSLWVQYNGAAELCIGEDGSTYLRNISLDFREEDERNAWLSVEQTGLSYSIGTGNWAPVAYAFGGDTFVVHSAMSDGEPCLCLFRQADTAFNLAGDRLCVAERISENVSVVSAEGELLYSCSHDYTNNAPDFGVEECLSISYGDETGSIYSYRNLNGSVEDMGFSSKAQAFQYVVERFNELNLTDWHFLGMVKLYMDYDACYKEENGAYVIPVEMVLACKEKE